MGKICAPPLFVTELRHCIATGKLWCAILFIKKGDYNTALLTINLLLSSIPSYAFYKVCGHSGHVVTDAKTLYADMFMNSKLSMSQIAKRAWLLNFYLKKGAMLAMPNAIDFPYEDTHFSPFTLAYYLQFLCYHGLRQYDNRDCALRQLAEVVDNPEQCVCNCEKSIEYYLAGRCFWMVGERVRAREMYKKSDEIKKNRKK